MVVVAPEPTGAPRPGTDRGRARRGRAGGHVVGVVVDLPGRAPQRVVGDVRPKHARLDAGGLDDVPEPSLRLQARSTCGDVGRPGLEPGALGIYASRPTGSGTVRRVRPATT